LAAARMAQRTTQLSGGGEEERQSRRAVTAPRPL
jgi:hypothetical protein